MMADGGAHAARRGARFAGAGEDAVPVAVLTDTALLARCLVDVCARQLPRLDGDEDQVMEPSACLRGKRDDGDRRGHENGHGATEQDQEEDAHVRDRRAPASSSSVSGSSSENSDARREGYHAVAYPMDMELRALANAIELAKNTLAELESRQHTLAPSPASISSSQRAEDEQILTASATASMRNGHAAPGRHRCGVPTIKAPAVSSSSCSQCRRHFSPFTRRRLCASCGYTFCPKCVARPQVLPTCFGFEDRVTHICRQCSTWFQRALNEYFESKVLLERQESETPPDSTDETNTDDSVELPQLLRNRPQSEPPLPSRLAAPVGVPLMWFGNYVPSTSSHDGADQAPVAQNEVLQESFRIRGRERLAIDTQGMLSSQHMTESRKWLRLQQREPAFSAELAPANGAGTKQVEESDADGFRRSPTEVRRSGSKRCKLVRSASFDLTVLLPDGADNTFLTPRQHVEASDTLSSSPSVSSRGGALGKKCFDDSDIVDSRRSTGPLQDEISVPEDVALPAAVIRFVVSDVSEGSGRKRALSLFGRRNMALDRLTLEVDYTRGMVRVKSVFMHRFWCFACSAVESITMIGHESAIARIKVANPGGSGSIKAQWEFASDEKCEEFRQAVETLRATKVKTTTQPRPQETYGSPALPAIVQRDDDRRRPAKHPRSDSQTLPSPSSDANSSHSSVAAGSVAGSAFPLLHGEQSALPLDIPASLLMSSSETAEAQWGRLRGTIGVTNFRVYFIPLEEGHVQYRSSTRGYAAYIPLFAVTGVKVSGPSGKRQVGTVLTISCKDARVMRLELEGAAHLAESRAQMLHSLLISLTDFAQRFRPLSDDDAIPMLSLDSPTSETDVLMDSTANCSPLADFESFRRNGSKQMVNSPGSRAFTSPALRPGASPQIMGLVGSLTMQRSGVFAFHYNIGNVPPECNGWNIYKDKQELQRQLAGNAVAQAFFKRCHNDVGQVCSTYPSQLLIPASLSGAMVADIAHFRANNRLPVVTYYHARRRCALVRSAQPLLGGLLSGSSNTSDQHLLNLYRCAPELIKNPTQPPRSSRPIYIFDARKVKASAGNRLMGKGGVETTQDYPGAVICHLNIANIYRMQSSFNAVIRLVLQPDGETQDKNWLSNLETTHWLSHVRLVLEGAVKIARVLELEGASALVHCSDGWDRTPQLVSLAQLLLDPFFRTVQGFAVLVEKDWCAFGHRFAVRLGGDRNKDPQRAKHSPVFFQFLDAVWQVQRQFPRAFEFNERFLLHVANALTSGLYGTFLYDSRLQREANGVAQKTVSVWTPVLMDIQRYQNPRYIRHSSPIWPWTSAHMMKLWEGYFFQWHPKYHGSRWITTLLRHRGQMMDEHALSIAVPPTPASLESSPTMSPSLSAKNGSTENEESPTAIAE